MKKLLFVIIALLYFSGFEVKAQTLEDGLSFITNENFPEARAVFKSLMEQDPKAPEPYFYMAETFFLYENLDSARYFYNLGMENVKGNSQALLHVGLGKLDYANHKKKEARDNFEKAERANRKLKDWRILYEIGRVYLEDEDRDLDMAIMKLEEAKDMARENPKVFMTLGDAYLLKNDGGAAANAYDYVLNRLNLQIPEIYLKKALLFKRSRVPEEAIKNLETAITLDPNFAPAYRDLIELYQDQKQYSKVTPLLEKYTNLVSDDIEARVRYVGFLFRQARDYDKTISEADKVLAEDPENFRMYRWKGYALVEKEQYELALESLAKFFDYVGDNKTYFTDFDYYGRAAAALGLHEDAEEKYKKALEFDISKADILDKIAKMYYEAKKFDKAAEAYKSKMLAVDPISTDYFYLGYSLFMGQNYAEADSAFAVVTEVLPDWINGWVYRARSNEYLDPEQDSLLAAPFHKKIIKLGEVEPLKNASALISAHRYLGYAAFKENNLEDAKDHFTQIQEIAELDPAKFKTTLKEIYGNLGYIYFQSTIADDQIKSKELYQKLLEIDPENEDAINALELLKNVKG
jgi:tetratricopeptide (TPR) repeat protein